MSQTSPSPPGSPSTEPLPLAKSGVEVPASTSTSATIDAAPAAQQSAAAAKKPTAAAHDGFQAAAAADPEAVTAMLEAAAAAATAAGWAVAPPRAPRQSTASRSAATAPAPETAAAAAGAAAAAAGGGGEDERDDWLPSARVSHKRQREVTPGGRGRARVRRGRGRAAAAKPEGLLGRLCVSSSGGEEEEEAAVHAAPSSAGSAGQSPRSNPQRLCRRRTAPLATTVEWTRMQVAQCKDLAEKVVWNTSDSPVFRHSLEVRPEPTVGVGLGLYLTRSLSSCCCTQAASVREAEQRLIGELQRLHQQERARALPVAQQQQQQQRRQEEAQRVGEGAGAAVEEHAIFRFAGPPEAAPSACASEQLQGSRHACAADSKTTLAGGRRQQQQQKQQQILQRREVTLSAAAAAAAAATTAAAADIESAADSRMRVSPAVSPSAGVPFSPEVREGGTTVGKRRLCSCNQSSCFRILCFRGDPVLSPFNFMASAGKGALTAEEKKVLMAPRENAGKGNSLGTLGCGRWATR
ncbi:hypothetical protein ACSSS7_004263 [Eimeria intestinalis]